MAYALVIRNGAHRFEQVDGELAQFAIVDLDSGERFTQERLQEVFSLVQNREDWKLGVNALVPASLASKREIEEAVSFFTATKATVVPEMVQTTCRHPQGLVEFGIVQPCHRVRATGYYAAGC